MPNELALAGLKHLLDNGHVQLIEVLPAKEYVQEHLPGALNIPLKSMSEETVAHLDRSAPTVVYCWDDI